MTDEVKKDGPEADEDSGNALPQQPRRDLMPLPGLVAIGFYMMILAGFTMLAVATGQGRPVYLVFSAAFISAGLGLLLLRRWAWALTLAAVVLLSALFLWRFSSQHDFFDIAQGLLNLVFFLYLVRAEVRTKLR